MRSWSTSAGLAGVSGVCFFLREHECETGRFHGSARLTTRRNVQGAIDAGFQVLTGLRHGGKGLVLAEWYNWIWAGRA